MYKFIVVILLGATTVFSSPLYTKQVTVSAGSNAVVNFKGEPTQALDNWIPSDARDLLISTDFEVTMSWQTNVIIKGFAGYESNYLYGVYWTNLVDMTNIYLSLTNIVEGVTNVYDSLTNAYVSTNAFTTNATEWVGYGSYTNTFTPNLLTLEAQEKLSLSFQKAVAPDKLYIFSDTNATVTITVKDNL